MMWGENVIVDVKSYSKHHINAIVQNKEGSLWRCTRVYGHPKTEEKKHTWELIRRLSGLSSLGLSSLPYLCIGDLNEILHLNEKIRGNERIVDLITNFREAIQDSAFVDLGYKRYPFTWSNRGC